MIEEKKKRRPKAGPALGNIDETKVVAQAIIDTQLNAAREKTERLKRLRQQREAQQDEVAR
ncbi:hypothetical protein C8J35_103325 [Rhizobium sp. PP-F2F-G38]|nr:hypothetical protein C8J37_103245 [Rhizobium sp. PP-WC-1G-195]PYE98725.1 hypothetical protein C8J35_103325 [Rhizobium sp. PP-F2F-G38]TCP89552.1 hypothetical protein C8J31_102732 [Rhizobium sp. PP-CC-2G-626]TCQ11582.1 hypothetical protein C8J34_101210 [Rhizobium sp. PP-F2F-G36]